MSSTNHSDFNFPDFYNFPPFFTIQSVLATREKQLALWRELILSYHTHYKIQTLKVYDCPLWKNERIQRQLLPDEIAIVAQDFCDSGHGEWLNSENGPSSKNISTKQAIRILWRKPDQLAVDIYQWAEMNGYIGSVVTVYELHSGEDVNGMSFQGANEELLRRALALLEDQGKCAIFKGDTSEEDGIKFS